MRGNAVFQSGLQSDTDLTDLYNGYVLNTAQWYTLNLVQYIDLNYGYAITYRFFKNNFGTKFDDYYLVGAASDFGTGTVLTIPNDLAGPNIFYNNI